MYDVMREICKPVTGHRFVMLHHLTVMSFFPLDAPCMQDMEESFVSLLKSYQAAVSHEVHQLGNKNKSEKM